MKNTAISSSAKYSNQLTADNGSEFSRLSELEAYGVSIIFRAPLFLMGKSPERTP